MIQEELMNQGQRGVLIKPAQLVPHSPRLVLSLNCGPPLTIPQNVIFCELLLEIPDCAQTLPKGIDPP